MSALGFDTLYVEQDKEKIFRVFNEAFIKEVLEKAAPTKKFEEAKDGSILDFMWFMWETLKMLLLSVKFALDHMNDFGEGWYEKWYKENIHPNRHDLHGFFGVN